MRGRILFLVSLFLLIAVISVGAVIAVIKIGEAVGLTPTIEDGISAISAAASALALIGVVYSLALQARAAQDAADVAAGDRQIEIDCRFVERPWLRSYFLDGQDIVRANPHFGEAMAMATLMANFFDCYFLSQRRHRHAFEDEAWEAYIRDHLKGSPILRRHIEQRAEWYSKRLVSMAISLSTPSS